ncbi:MAG: aldehyde dehydrogenase (NADP(+)), partial [Pseudomonadota bacterium]
ALLSCRSSTTEDVDTALAAAEGARAVLRHKSGTDIAALLSRIADEIEALGDELITTGMRESGLPEARLLGERGRTCGQLRAFADLVEEGSWVEASIDTALPDRTPLPKPDVRAMLAPLGPVAVFGASNFPFAFGTLGGDSASALAGGNPIVVKGHPGHPATCTLFAQAASRALSACGFPAGTFSLLQGASHELGGALVRHPLTQAVGFTGSEAGGRALMDIAAARQEPIPVFAEMGSINPVFLMPEAVANRGDSIASDLAGSIAMGTGQFCTSPGLIVTADAGFADKLSAALAEQARGVLLNPGIASGLARAITAREHDSAVEVLTGGGQTDNALVPQNTLMRVSAEHFLASPALLKEVFGPVSLLVQCDSVAQMQAIAEYMEGNLTATIHTDDADGPAVATLLDTLATRTGRILFNGYPTGVEVCPSMQHGGPYPASSAAATTSVGTPAITRFTRRVAYQNCPSVLLPAALQDANPLGIWRRLNGEQSRSQVN